MKTVHRVVLGLGAAAAAIAFWRWRAGQSDGDAPAADLVLGDLAPLGYESNAQREAREARDASSPRPPPASAPTIADVYAPVPTGAVVQPNLLDRMIADAGYRREILAGCIASQYDWVGNRSCRLWRCYTGQGGCSEFGGQANGANGATGTW